MIFPLFRPITDLTSDSMKRLVSCDDCGKICVYDYNNNNKQLVKQMVFIGFDEYLNSFNLYINYQN